MVCLPVCNDLPVLILTCISPSGHQQYTCSHCLKSYKYPNQLKIHIRFRCRHADHVTTSGLGVGGANPHALEAYYRHALGRRLYGEGERGVRLVTNPHSPHSSAFSPPGSCVGQGKRSSPPHKEPKEEKRACEGQGSHPVGGGMMSPLMGYPYPLGAQMTRIDPALALSYYQYHPLYAHLYPQMALYYHQMAPLVPAMHAPTPVSPSAPMTSLSPGSDLSSPPKDLSPVHLSPLGFPLPSETAGEPLDLLPRSLYTSKTRKGHVCIYCGKLYSRKYGLKIHLRTHTGYKPLKCKVCQRPFGDPSNLNKHIRLHAEGDTPYRCLYCGKVLVRRRDLERHIKSRHPNATDNDTVEVTSALSSPEHVTGSDLMDSPDHVTGSDILDRSEDATGSDVMGSPIETRSCDNECQSESDSDMGEEEEIDVV